MLRRMLLALSFSTLFVMYAWPITHTPITITVAMGNSMYPTMGPVSLIIGVRPHAVSAGDIVLYQMPSGTNVAHRVVEVLTDDIIITKGDNNFFIDPPVRLDMIKYKVIYYINPPISILLIVALNMYLVSVPTYMMWTAAREHFRKRRERPVLNSGQ